MTIELIRQARERLETLKAESTQGVWESEIIASNFGYVDSEEGSIFLCESNVNDGELAVTLHRTIDAQLAILHHAQAMLSLEFAPADAYSREIALAKAIMGVE